MTRVLVTGANGFIGANLVRRLLRDGHEVHALVHLLDHRLTHVRSDIEIYSLHEQYDCAMLLKKVRPEIVFHLAASGVYTYQRSIGQMIEQNAVLTRNLLMASGQYPVRSFVYAGSSLEYGHKDHPASENEDIAPTTPYGMSKALATLYIQQMQEQTDMNITTLRLYSVYGPYEAPTRLIPTLIEHGLQGKLPPMANPDNARDFVHVEDVCDAFIKAAEAPQGSQIYNVGMGKQTTLREVVELSRRVFGIEEEARWNTSENRAWDTSVWVADNRKIKEQLRWEPRYTFETGFQQTIEWTKEQQLEKA